MNNPQHRRSLATGLFSAAMAPIAIGILLLIALTGTETHSLQMVVPISLIGLLISIPSTLFGALPLFLVLRHKSILCGLLLCLGCGIIGAIAITTIPLVFYSGYSAKLLGPVDQVITFYLILGFAFGAVAGLALTLGAGVPFGRSSLSGKART